MLVEKKTDQPEAKPQARRLVINLVSRDGQKVNVRSCEVISERFRNRTSFTDGMSLDNVFVTRIAEGLRHCLGKLSNKTEVMSLPNITVEVPGLVLSSVQMMSALNKDGSLNIIFRFMFCVGSVSNAFIEDIGFDDSIHDHTAELSSRILSDLAMPILDLCAATEAGVIDAGAALGPFGVKLVERADEIRFQIELLKRYADGQEGRQTNETPVHLADLNNVTQLIRDG